MKYNNNRITASQHLPADCGDADSNEEPGPDLVEKERKSKIFHSIHISEMHPLPGMPVISIGNPFYSNIERHKHHSCSQQRLAGRFIIFIFDLIAQGPE